MNTIYKVILLRKLNNTYFQFKTLSKVNFQDSLVKFGKRSFMLDLENSFYESKDLFNRRILIYLIDFDSGLQFKRQNIIRTVENDKVGYTFEGSGIFQVTPELIDEMGEGVVMKHFSNSMREHSQKFQIGVAIFFALFGLLSGLIAAYFYFNEKFVMIAK